MERKKKKLIYNVVVSLLLITGLVWVCSHFVHLGNVNERCRYKMWIAFQEYLSAWWSD